MQVLFLQEESVGAPGGASHGQTDRWAREEREDEARVQILSGKIRLQETAEETHEESTRIHGTRSDETPVRSVRRGIVVDETINGAQTQSYGREDLRMRHVRQEIRQQGEPEYPQTNAHG